MYSSFGVHEVPYFAGITKKKKKKQHAKMTELLDNASPPVLITVMQYNALFIYTTGNLAQKPTFKSGFSFAVISGHF